MSEASGSAADEPSINNRRENRFPSTERMILLMPWGDAGGFEARRVKLLDCSAHGLGLEDTAGMPPGQSFAVYLQIDQASTSMVLYTVQHCTKLPSGVFKIGAKLEGFIDRRDSEPDQVLTTLLEQRLV